ncbi:MAG: Crp/Fnr family transcriptional regulator [Candidatus Bathyarchaeota archaeon]|nr:Crp/Fnr family transcriptional regulator [Candidatus Termiticorpusculum sp.]
MKKIFETAKNNPLLQGIAFSDFEQMMTCLSAKTTTYKKDDTILLTGNTINFVGIILSGSIKTLKEDPNGQTTLLTQQNAPELFGETYACAGIDHSPITIQATENNTEILLIDYKRINTSCTSACPYHRRLIKNMLKIIATKNIILNQKIEILTKRTTREKLVTYLNTQKGPTKKFTIPYNRKELAQHLCVDRSAMSNELCKMRNEGLIKFNKNTFEIIQQP